MTEREQFEQWAKIDGLNIYKKVIDGDYVFASTIEAWKGWQAARATPALPQGVEEVACSPTKGMNLGERIAHVGGRENEAGYIEFGSVMAVDALINHILRDIRFAAKEKGE